MNLEVINQRLDFSDPSKTLTINDLDPEMYLRKFKLWDYVEDNKILKWTEKDMVTNAMKVTQARAQLLLADDTIYNYAFFLDDDGLPFEYTIYQDAIGSLKHDFTPLHKHRFILFRAANQIGKSRLLCGKALKIIGTERNVNVVMISKSLPQSQFLLSQIYQTLNNSLFANSWKYNVGEKKNTTTLTFQYKKKIQGRDRVFVNRIICAPAGKGALGYPVHYMFLDEIDFYEDAKKFFWGVALPRTNKTKGQIIGFTNPNWEISRHASILYELEMSDLFQRKFHFKFMDAPWNQQEEYDRVKKSSPSYIFMSTHDGNYSDAAGAFFKKKEIDDMLQKDWHNQLPNLNIQIFLALDIAKQRDYTVLSLGYKVKGKAKDGSEDELFVPYVLKFEHKTDMKDVADKVKYIVDYYKINFGIDVIYGYDATGFGFTFAEILELKGLTSAIPVDFNAKTTKKTKLYADFKRFAEQRLVKIVYTEEIEKQLAMLTFKETKTGQLSVEAEKDKYHDDVPDSVAVLINISLNPDHVPVSVKTFRPVTKHALATKSNLTEYVHYFYDNNKFLDIDKIALTLEISKSDIKYCATVEGYRPSEESDNKWIR